MHVDPELIHFAQTALFGIEQTIEEIQRAIARAFCGGIVDCGHEKFIETRAWAARDVAKGGCDLRNRPRLLGSNLPHLDGHCSPLTQNGSIVRSLGESTTEPPLRRPPKESAATQKTAGPLSCQAARLPSRSEARRPHRAGRRRAPSPDRCCACTIRSSRRPHR